MTTNRNPHNLTVGQVLVFVPDDARYRKMHDVTVTKIGRQWAHIENYGRVSLETLWVDGGGYPTPGRCYLSREAYEAEHRRTWTWNILHQRVGRRFSAPDGVSIEAMQQVATLLGMGPLPEPTAPTGGAA